MTTFDFSDSALKRHEVRLFPTVGIKGEKEAEMRATAALLAMVRAVAEFSQEIINKAGGPGGKVKNAQCFTEVSFLPDFPEDNDPARPDGIIRKVFGKKVWTALVEVKVGENQIDEKQVNTYLKWAKFLNFDALITISNQITKPNGDPPYSFKKIKKVEVKHFSWEAIHSIAQFLCGKDESLDEERIVDVDQQWMLEQFNHYLADENSKIIAPPTFGKSWHSILQHVKANTLNVHPDLVQDLVEHWLAFLRVASLRLGAKIGKEVRVRIPAKFKKDPAGLIKMECKQTIDTGFLTGELIFPKTVMDDIRLCLDLKKKELQLSHKIDAPEEGLRDTRVKWIINELKKLELKKLELKKLELKKLELKKLELMKLELMKLELMKLEKVLKNLRIKVDWKKFELVTSELYGKLGDGIVPLLRGKGDKKIDKSVMPKCFILERETPLCGAPGKGSAQELKGVLDDLEDFYRLVQPINRPVKKPSPLAKDVEAATETLEA